MLGADATNFARPRRRRSPGTAAAAWTRKGPLRGRAGYPGWVLVTPLWIVHGDDDKLGPEQAAQWADTFKACMANSSALNNPAAPPGPASWALGYHWYNWQTEAFDQEYPAMTPRPGLAAAVAAIQDSGQSGIAGHVMLFTNARPVWDPRAANVSQELFGAGSAYSCNWTSTPGPQGRTSMSPIGWDSYSYGLMADLGTPWVQQTWGGQVAAHALQSGADAVYLDQLACSNSVACLGGTAESWASGGRALLAAATGGGGGGTAVVGKDSDVTITRELPPGVTDVVMLRPRGA
eukprot:SAG22_NODE_1371_length_4582_cov_3.882222_2_plen_292_part_00